MAQTFETQSDYGDHNCFSESGVYEQQHAQGIMGSAILSHGPTAGVLVEHVRGQPAFSAPGVVL